MPDEKPNRDEPPRLIRATAWIGIWSALVLGLIFIIRSWDDNGVRDVELRHFGAVIGLPVAALGAFVLIALFRTVEGQIKGKLWKFEFEGAAGPIIMWIFCFLAMVVALKVMW
jgi:hypothetical protein